MFDRKHRRSIKPLHVRRVYPGAAIGAPVTRSGRVGLTAPVISSFLKGDGGDGTRSSVGWMGQRSHIEVHASDML
jgi:hypothetical protein